MGRLQVFKEEMFIELYFIVNHILKGVTIYIVLFTCEDGKF